MLLSKVSTSILAVAFIAWIARLLTKEEFAVLALIEIFKGVVFRIRGLGLTALVMRDAPALLSSPAAGERELGSRHIQSAFWYSLVATALVVGVAWPSAPWLSRVFLDSPAHADWVRLILCYSFFTSTLDSLQNTQVAVHQFGSISAVSFVNELSQRVLGIGLFFWLGINGYLIGILLGSAAGVLMAVWHLRAFLLRVPRLLRPGPLLKRAAPYYLSEWGRYGSLEADQLILGILTRPEVMATYYLARRVFDYLKLFFPAYLNPILPRISASRSHGPERVRGLFHRSSRYLFLITVPIAFGVAAVAPFVIGLLGGERYAGAWPALTLLASAFLFFGWSSFYRSYIFMLAGPRQLIAYEGATGLLSIALLTAFAMATGTATGIALGMLFSTMGATLIGWLQLRAVERLPLDRAMLGRSLLAGSIMAVAVVTAEWVYDEPWAVVLYMAGGALLYTLLMIHLLTREQYMDLDSLLPSSLSRWTGRIRIVRPEYSS